MRRLEAHAVARLALVPALVLVLALVVVLAGCRPNADVPTVVVGTAPPETGSVTPPPSSEPATPLPVGQVDTDWGPIWARVPETFPTPPRAEPAEADTTVSAAWTVPAGARPAAREVAQFYADRFSEAGLGGGLDGPLEDGSYSVWASNGYGCDILVTTQRRGDDETFATVLFGAGCPFSWLATGLR